MSSNFLVQFRVHIVEDKRPKDEGFLPVYLINELFRAENDTHLGQMINARYEYYITAPGITVFRDATKILPNGTGNVQNRLFIPWHMIAYFNANITLIPEPEPVANDSLVPADETPVAEAEVIN